METYLVRIWTPTTADAPQGDVRGFVEHVGHGEKVSFIGVEQLLATLSLRTRPDGPRDSDVREGAGHPNRRVRP